MIVKVLLETHCAGCKTTLEAVQKAAATLPDTTVEAVTDVKEILSYKVWRMPAVVVDGKVVSFGKNLSFDAAKQLLESVKTNA